MPPQPFPLNRLYLALTLAEPAFGDTTEHLFYARTADGRRSIVRQSTLTGLADVITTEPAPSGGVGYGGGLFAVRGDMLIYAAKDKTAKSGAAKTGRLIGVDLNTGAQWEVTPHYEGVAAPAISPCGQFVAFLAESDGKCNVMLCDVRGKASPVKLSNDPWYAFNPTFSADGARMAWQEWNELDMPWDEARLQIAAFARPTPKCAVGYELLPLSVTTLRKPRVSYASPQFSPGGKYLAYTSDETGWRSLWIAGVNGRNPVQVDMGESEVGGPDWVPGLVKIRWSLDGKCLYAVRRRHSRDTLVRVDWPGRAVTEIPTEWTWLDTFNVRGDWLTFVAANPTTPAALVTLDTATGQCTPRATTGVGLIDGASLSTPDVLSWTTANDQTAWGLLYPATGSDLPRSQLRPLIVHVHGGPTSETPLKWDAQAQYFAARGWHYLCVNHRGGTGFGRAYQELLDGQWGVMDVQDARTGAEHLISRGLVDATRVVITGGSAGGYTTLMALTQDPDFWTAGVSLFGIGEMYELRQGSHRFEVNYEFGLVGKLPEAGPLWVQRSPLTFVKNVRAPVLLFHGQEDKAVPYQQSVDFAEAVRRNGGKAELVLYDDEGHGFVKEANRRDCCERMEKFLDKYVLCLQK